MRAVILTNRQGNQLALINKLHPHVDIAAVVFSNNIPKRRPPAVRRARMFANRVTGRFFGTDFRDVWNRMLARYSETYPSVPVEHQLEVDNVNDDATLSVIEKFSPDLVIVSGTNIVGSKVIDSSHRSGKIMNLHTGISPYVKGGPNCTNWCLANGWFHLIGNTVMWIDKGIDTGNIITTERTPLDGTESLFDLHWKVMEHAHDLYVRAVKRFTGGDPLPDIPQNSITEGNLFLSMQWNYSSMRAARRNFERNYAPFFRSDMSKEPDDIKLFPLT